jgi:hypothetical protein
MNAPLLLALLGIGGGALLLASRASGSSTAPPSSPSPAPPGRPTALDLARAELGATEVPLGSNTGGRVSVYLARSGFSAAPWCAAFISFILAEAGITLLPYSARVAALVASARAIGRWRDVDAGHSPAPGDLAVFRRSGQDPRQGGDGHIAMVESAGGGLYAAIGGNEADAVRRTVRALSGDPALVGWIALPEAAAFGASA